MKKVLSILLVVVMILSLSACNNKQPTETTPPDTVITEPETPTIDESQPTEEVPERTEAPELLSKPTVGDIMAIALKHLSEEQYVTGSAVLSDDEKCLFQINTLTGEYYESYVDIGSSAIYTDEYYAVKESNGYISYEIEIEDDLEGNRLDCEAEKYVGYQNTHMDLSFLNWIEAYLTLSAETEIINGVECYVLVTSDNVPELFFVDDITLYIDATTGKLMSFHIEDNKDTAVINFTYEEFSIQVPDEIIESATLQNETYDDEFHGLVKPSTYSDEDKELYNILFDDISIKVGDKADFINNKNEKLIIESGNPLLLDGLNTNNEITVENGIVPEKVFMTYDVTYQTEEFSYRNSIITSNNTDKPMAEDECIIVGILHSDTISTSKNIMLSDIKAIYGNQYERFIVDDELVLVWAYEDYSILVSVYEEDIDMFAIMHNSLFDTMKALLFQPVDEVKEPLKPMPVESAATFIINGKEYKLCSSTNGDFAPHLSETEEKSIMSKSKMYMSLYQSFTSPLALLSVGPNDKDIIFGYSVFAIEDTNNNFKMSNGLSLKNTYDDFMFVFGEPDSTEETDDGVQATWSDNNSMFMLKAVFDEDTGKAHDIMVMDMTPYALDIILDVVNKKLGENLSGLFDAIKPN